jgi:hypothetical protein
MKTTKPDRERALVVTTKRRRIAFRRIADAALRYSQVLVRRWLPDGRQEGAEWVAINPTRNDRRKGSFKVNMTTGRWSEFATGEAGGDLISLAAYLFRRRQVEAAIKLAEAIGADPYE